MKKSDYLNLFVSGMLLNGFIWNITHHDAFGAFVDLFLSAILFLLFLHSLRKIGKHELSLGTQVRYLSMPEKPFIISGIKADRVEIEGDFSSALEFPGIIFLGRKWVSKDQIVKWKNDPKLK